MEVKHVPIQSGGETQAVQPTEGAWATAADVATVFASLAIVALSVVGIALLWRTWRLLGELDRARSRLGALAGFAETISANVDAITGSVRREVDELTGAVGAVGDGVRQAADGLIQRVDDLNALLAVVQSEAEALFVDAASAVRGLREGAKLLRVPGRASPSAGKEQDGNSAHGTEAGAGNGADPAKHGTESNDGEDGAED